MEALLLFGLLFFLIAIGVPIAISLGMSSVIVIMLFDTTTLMFQARSIVTSINSYPLLAVPLFILAGDLMYSGGLSKRIIAFVDSLVGHFRGGLAYVNVLASTFFAAISGSSPATVAAIGSNMIPEMEKREYSKEYSTSLTAASGMIGVMIPPSIPFIMYGISAEQSVSALFIAGVIPGLLFAVGFMMTAYILYIKSGFVTVSGALSLTTTVHTFKKAFWALLAPVIILGGIYGGIFSPTEAAAVAVFYSLIVGIFIYRDLKIRDIPNVFAKSALTTGTVLSLVVFASTFGRILALEQVPTNLANFLTNISDNPIIILLLINIFLLFVGMFMETIASIIILTPILLPVVMQLGIDPVLFGVILTVNLAIGFCTPPLGVNLFVASGISGLSIEKLSKAILPYFVIMIALLLLISYVPSISLYLPDLLIGK
ncbi:TRAP transporter large permease [Guptibacillus hwajinpoensis]|uniref:C4-dicarboxylate transporter DctM subunit n=1 Tax=Guptibacillus hwajinpoensis TaxID=208199 RepID=A0ABU0JVL0_9BACL|nr:TRAP transporter large permease [Alkalihalobacillus hemicentroti]MDQ0481129.1 C4-dicarboxylate transporter DctM subunit [Alkalihalobacillus hemicentroti]